MTPEDVLGNTDLADDEKAALLCQMAYDAAELAVATEEGMPGDGNDLQRRVLLALHRLQRRVDVEHTAPTKQHAARLRQPG
jgi:hypothetical protein